MSETKVVAFPFRGEGPRRLIWHCKDGRQIPLDTMATEHIINILRFMRRKLEHCHPIDDRREYIDVQSACATLELELIGRKVKVPPP